MKRLAFILVCTGTSLASVASADSPRFEVIDRDSAVEIIAHDVTATSTAITPVRSRLEVPIAQRDNIPKLVPAGEKTVKVVELDGHSQKVLSVKLAFERPDVQALAKFAQAMQVGNDLHLIVPRAIPAVGQTVQLPEPTLPPQLAEKAAAIAPTVTTVAAPPAIPIEKHEPAPVAKPEPAPTKSAAVAKAPEPNVTNNVPILAALTLAAFGCAVWLKRRNRTSREPASSIEVIAQKSLGAKAKVVWLRAGEREMIVAVAPQTVRMLGQWRKGDAPERRANLPEAITHHSAPESSSPAVAGILKLRARTTSTHQIPVEAINDADADSAWAKEILAATTGARR